MKNCSEIQLNLMDYTLGRLTPSESEDVRTHLLVCGECRTILEEEKALSSGLAELGSVAPANDVWALIRSQTRPRPAFLEVIRTRTARMLVAGVAVAAAVLALVDTQITQKQSPMDNDSVRAVASMMMINQERLQEGVDGVGVLTSTDDPLGSSSDALAAAIDEGI